MDRLLTAAELAPVLQIDASTVLRLAKAGKIPCVRVGGSVRFAPDIIARLIEQGYNAHHERIRGSSEAEKAQECDDRGNVVGGVVRERRRRKARASERESRTMREAVAQICEGLTIREGVIIAPYDPVDPLTFRNGSMVAPSGGAVEQAQSSGGSSDD